MGSIVRSIPFYCSKTMACAVHLNFCAFAIVFWAKCLNGRLRRQFLFLCPVCNVIALPKFIMIGFDAESLAIFSASYARISRLALGQLLLFAESQLHLFRHKPFKIDLARFQSIARAPNDHMHACVPEEFFFPSRECIANGRSVHRSAQR